MTVIRTLDEHITIFSKPFARFQLIPVGGRSTSVKLENGNLVLFASHARDQETEDRLRQLGNTVSHIIALDVVHNLYLSDYMRMYPQAKLVGPKGLVKKRKDLKIDIVLPDDGLDAELDKEFKAIPMTGHPNEDIVWYHKRSRTIIEADVVFNLVDKDQKAFSLLPTFLIKQMSPHTALHRYIASAFSKKDVPGFTRAARTINDLDFERLIPCHGAVIEGPAAKEAWRSVFRKFLPTEDKRE